MTEELESKQTDGTKETRGVRGTLYETTRTILLAGIGAISLAQDEVNNFVDKLVERGQMAETDARKLVNEVMDRRETLERERRQQAAEARRPAAATRADIEALNARIAELTQQIDELRKRQSQEG